MLYFPWWNEETDLLGSFKEHYEVVQRIVLDNENKYTLANVEDIEVFLDNAPDHPWNLLAPSTEANRARLVAGDESLTEIPQQNLRDNAEMLASSFRSGTVALRLESAAKSCY